MDYIIVFNLSTKAQTFFFKGIYLQGRKKGSPKAFSNRKKGFAVQQHCPFSQGFFQQEKRLRSATTLPFFPRLFPTGKRLLNLPGGNYFKGKLFSADEK